MKQFQKWLVEMDDLNKTQGAAPGAPPPVNGGITPQIPPEIAQELSGISQKLTDLLAKLGIGKQGDGSKEIDKPEKGLGDKGAGDAEVGAAAPNFTP